MTYTIPALSTYMSCNMSREVDNKLKWVLTSQTRGCYPSVVVAQSREVLMHSADTNWHPTARGETYVMEGARGHHKGQSAAKVLA